MVDIDRFYEMLNEVCDELPDDFFRELHHGVHLSEDYKPSPYAENGDMVVALIEDSATVKTFYKENGYIRLQPQNMAMDPIIVHGDMQILGKVFGVMRFFH